MYTVSMCGVITMKSSVLLMYDKSKIKSEGQIRNYNLKMLIRPFNFPPLPLSHFITIELFVHLPTWEKLCLFVTVTLYEPCRLHGVY
jgi:hypothetical protein